MTHNVAILGASGYTGAELVRLIANHPKMRVTALSADRKAGQSFGDVFPHLRHLAMPELGTIDSIDFGAVDLTFCALPHGVTHGLVRNLPNDLKVVDLSADFRLRDAAAYKKWYKIDHAAMDVQREVAYGLPEIYRSQIRAARITANTGCYVVTALLPLIPLLEARSIDPERIVIDAASGVTGAGRGAKETSLFAEVGEGFSAYGVGGHRHMGELEQELSRAAGQAVVASFTPHLLPISRGMMATIYVDGDAEALHGILSERYSDEPFVEVLPHGRVPATQHARGSNLCMIGLVPDRAAGRTIIVSVVDNLTKGASGQALQCANLMLGLDETAGLTAPPVFP
jgi:N-acetyl-gamma-glutamyl-phosphate reductase